MRTSVLSLAVLLAVASAAGHRNLHRADKVSRCRRWAEYQALYNKKDPTRFAMPSSAARSGEGRTEVARASDEGEKKDGNVIYQMLVPGQPQSSPMSGDRHEAGRQARHEDGWNDADMIRPRWRSHPSSAMYAGCDIGGVRELTVPAGSSRPGTSGVTSTRRTAGHLGHSLRHGEVRGKNYEMALLLRDGPSLPHRGTPRAGVEVRSHNRTGPSVTGPSFHHATRMTFQAAKLQA